MRVEWLDIVEYSHEEERYAKMLDADMGPANCISYGEFRFMDGEKLVIARESVDGEADRQVFPIGCVVKVEVLNGRS